MNKFDKPACSKLRADLTRILGEYAEKEGLVFDLGNFRFTETEVRFTTMRCRVKNAPKREEAALVSMTSIYGLKTTNGNGDRLVEFNRRRYAYPFVYVSGTDGKRYKCSYDSAKARFGMA